MTVLCRGQSIKTLSSFIDSLQAFRFFHSAAAAQELGLSQFDNAHNLFDEFPQRDIGYYNSILFYYSRDRLYEQALKLYVDIHHAGMPVDQCSLSCVLKASASVCNHAFGRQTHCQCFKNGFLEDVSVGTSLVDMYMKNGCMGDGEKVFDEMREPNVVTWTSLITGYAKKCMIERVLELFKQMKVQDVEPNPFTFATILGVLADRRAVEAGVQAHAMIIKCGFGSVRVVGNSLVNMYGKCGLINEAKNAFSDTESRDAVSWNGMIAGLVANELDLQGFELFRWMQLAVVKFTETTFATMVKLCTNLKDGSLAKQIHSQIIRYGFDSFDNIRTGLMFCYMRVHEMSYATKLFSALDGVRSVVSWTAMIKGLQQNGKESDAISLFLRMRREEVRPNHYTYSTIMSALSSTSSFFQVHGEIVKTGYESSPSVGTALLDAYMKLGWIDDAAKIFERIEEKDVVAWSAMLVGYVQEENTEGAVHFYKELVNEGVLPNEYTFSSIINACALPSAATEQGKQFHASSIKFAYNNALIVSSALVTMYSKKGDITSANFVFERQQERDLISWNSMITGFAQHGYGKKALSLFEEMQARNIEMDEITFVGVICACTHAGLVKEGENYFDMAVNKLRIDPTMEMYSCMIDLYSRAGMLENASALINKMPFPAGPMVWRTLLAACQVHRKLELGQFAAEKLISIQPNDSAAYVLLANLYAAAGKWPERAKVRKLMDERQVKKETGYSWIEVKNKTHSFIAGDISHPLSQQIYSKLGELSIRLRNTGYQPDTTYVVHDIEEEQKEAILSRHSERIALAFGLISLPSSITIRILKNLRVCGDCHTVFKLTSELEGRDIVLRDSNRFHHFSRGLCSCGDYW